MQLRLNQVQIKCLVNKRDELFKPEVLNQIDLQTCQVIKTNGSVLNQIVTSGCHGPSAHRFSGKPILDQVEARLFAEESVYKLGS